MSTKIETKTNELCQAILEEIQANGIRNRIDAFLSDANARGQFETVNRKGQALHEKQHNGEQLNNTEVADFEKDRDALLKNPVAKNFLDAQDELHELQHTVQKRIHKALELGRMPTEEDLSEGSCGHGCGCGHNH
ncbi:MAG TPA: YlbF family regulator [Verrucomicrobiae bacterium]|nr:YlbF family regulator [Verrucomicrobiae bacterium]